MPQCPERTNCLIQDKHELCVLESFEPSQPNVCSASPLRHAPRMRNAVRDSCVCGVSVQTTQREKQELSVSSKGTVRRTSAVPSIKV